MNQHPTEESLSEYRSNRSARNRQDAGGGGRIVTDYGDGTVITSSFYRGVERQVTRRVETLNRDEVDGEGMRGVDLAGSISLGGLYVDPYAADGYQAIPYIEEEIHHVRQDLVSAIQENLGITIDMASLQTEVGMARPGLRMTGTEENALVEYNAEEPPPPPEVWDGTAAGIPWGNPLGLVHTLNKKYVAARRIVDDISRNYISPHEITPWDERVLMCSDRIEADMIAKGCKFLKHVHLFCEGTPGSRAKNVYSHLLVSRFVLGEDKRKIAKWTPKQKEINARLRCYPGGYACAVMSVVSARPFDAEDRALVAEITRAYNRADSDMVREDAAKKLEKKNNLNPQENQWRVCEYFIELCDYND